MKKLTLAVFAVVIGFVMTSCGGVSPKETIIKATDEFFAQAEQDLNTIENAEDFMAFFNVLESDKEDFIQNVFADYVDGEGNIKGISESDMEEINNYIYDRATAYNKIEGAKAGEFMEPLIADYENAVYALCENFGNVDQETFENMTLDFDKAETALRLFADYDNVPTALQERAQAAQAKLDELLTLLAQ